MDFGSGSATKNSVAFWEARASHFTKVILLEFSAIYPQFRLTGAAIPSAFSWRAPLQQRTRPDNIRRMKPWPLQQAIGENGGKWNLLIGLFAN